ncbi:MAG: insulinase family protein [Muribaculaceae bacterium]|nr:insulinase family protein [Muribaculaceae bacterium]
MDTLDRKTPPPVSGFAELHIPEVRHLTLDNGIPLTVLDSGEQEVNRLTLAWDGGIAETRLHAIASLTSNMLREGSRHHSGSEIAETFDYNGSWLKSSVMSHHTSVVAHSLNSRTAEILPILSEIVTEPVFPEKEFSVLREKAARSIELEREKVEYYSSVNLRRMTMGHNHPLAHNDEPDEVRAISTEDLYTHHQRVFNKATCEIFLAGRITPAIEETVNRNFGIGERPAESISLDILPFSPSDGDRLKITKRDNALQSSVKIAIPTIGRDHPDYIPLRIAIIALGGYFGSRLMTNIREDKGYTYGINASLLGYREGGLITISSQCDNRYVNPLLDEVKKEITRLASETFPPDELERVKKHVMTQLASTLDSPFTMMDYYENIRYTPTPPDYFPQQIRAVESLTTDDIPRLISKHIDPERLYTSICGNI